jgi:hypothetical protein
MQRDFNCIDGVSRVVSKVTDQIPLNDCRNSVAWYRDDFNA